MEDNETSSHLKTPKSDKNSEEMQNLVHSDKASQQGFLCRNTDKVICMCTWKKA